MKLNLRSMQFKIFKNFEFFFVLLLILVSIFITQIYNASQSRAQYEYIKILNNLYFQKTVKNIFDNLPPKYLNVEHIVVANESMTGILKKYGISENESKLIDREIKSKIKNYTLKVKQKIFFTIDKKSNKISKLTFPVSKTRKLLISKDLTTNNFISTDVVTNLMKKE